MTINQNKDRMVRIAKLMAVTIDNGATKGEEDNAKSLAEKLMADYNISQAEVLKAAGGLNSQVAREKCRIYVVDTIKYGAWQATTHTLANPVAKFCDCKHWFTKGDQIYSFFGLPEDAMSAGYLFEALGNQIVEACNKYRDGEEYSMERGKGMNHQTVMSSFLRGIEAELASRLRAMTDAKNGIVEQATGTALVVLKNEIVVSDFADTGIKLHSGGEKYRQPGSNAAFKSGIDAGKKANMGQTGIGSPNKRISK